MEKETHYEFICRVTKELGHIQLSSACGNNICLIHSFGNEVLVKRFAGKYGYKLLPILTLTKEEIETIYNDLKVDFE